MLRKQLTKEMNIIHNDLIKMGAMVEQAIDKSTSSLKNKDIEMAEKVIKSDQLINEMELEIEKKCMVFIARQQPLATDLREILVMSKMITDLERIGDHCEDIAKYTIKLKNQAYIKELIDIPKMSALAAEMVKKSLDAFVEKDSKIAKEVYRLDQKIDELYQEIFKELMELMQKDKNKVTQSTVFLFVAAHLERIGDYAKNICEKTVYLVDGNYVMEEL